MERSRAVGALIMAGAALQMLFFLIGAARRSYMAVALPVMGGLSIICALAFWVGWTMMTAEPELEELEEEELERGASEG
jgi:NADH:ubiquinone oxidoreductase subunit H